MNISLTLLMLVILAPIRAESKTLTIAVIDTGIDSKNPKLCKEGHKSYVDNDPLKDEGGHGTHVAGLINKHAGDLDYCLVSIKWWKKGIEEKEAVANTAASIQYANNINVSFINYSGGGPNGNDGEKNAIIRALKANITIVVAAGNESNDLDSRCNFYPACYDKRLVIVGNLQDEESSTRKLMSSISAPNKQPFSNYGNYVNRWEVGTNVKSDNPNGGITTMTGTSQAAAIATGKLVRAKLIDR